MKRIWILTLTLLLSVATARAANESYLTYLQGMSEERAGNTSKALEAYEKAVKLDPQAVQIYRDIAELRMRSGQPDQALHAALKVKDLAPNDPMSFIFLGNVYVAQGELSKASEAYVQALKVDPTNLRALENLGNYFALTDPEKALSYYQKYLEISPRDADINFQIAIVHHRAGRFSKALSFYKKSIEEEPTQVASHLAIADLYEQQKSTADAVAAYRKAAEIQPDSALVYSRLGGLYYRDGKWDEAWKAFQSAEAASPNDSAVHFSMARVAEERKDWKQAVAHAEKAWTLSQDPQLLPLVAYFLTLDHEPAKAVKYLEKAREIEPESANVLLFLGLNYLDLDKPEQARDALAKGVALHPKDSQMRFHLATAEDKLGHFEAAEAQFQEILKIDPKHAPSLNYLGYSWAERGVKLDEAEQMLRQALAIDPENGAFLDSLGWIRFKRGDACDARSYLERAARISGDAVISEHLGDAYFGCGAPGAAVMQWTRSLMLAPQNETLRQKIQSEGGKYLASADSAKFATYLEGNFKQIEASSASIRLKTRIRTKSLTVQGTLLYHRSRGIRLLIPATDKTAALVYTLDHDQLRADPPQKNPFQDQMALDGLTAMSQLLSGQLTTRLKPYLDAKSGLHVRFSRPNVSGGDDVIQVTGFDFIDGLWVPVRLKLINDTTGWSGETELSDWVLNDKSIPAIRP